MMLLIVLIGLFVMSFRAATLGKPRYGRWSWSPAVIIVVVGFALYFTGHMKFVG